eukprot:1324222-Amorphochlora_amoeboformis.AAC.2
MSQLRKLRAIYTVQKASLKANYVQRIMKISGDVATTEEDVKTPESSVRKAHLNRTKSHSALRVDKPPQELNLRDIIASAKENASDNEREKKYSIKVIAKVIKVLKENHKLRCKFYEKKLAIAHKV